MIRIASDRPPRRLRYGLPILLVTIATGLGLLLGPAVAARGLFDLLLLPVLIVSLALGLGPALASVVLGALIGALVLTPFGMPWVTDSLHLV